MPAKARVDIMDFINDDLAPEREILGDVAEVRALDAKTQSELEGQIDDADCLVMYHFVELNREMISRLKRCKVIVRSGVGYDNVDIAAARDAGIDVCNIPDYGTEEVADAAAAMMLALMRGTNLFNSRLRAGHGPWQYTQAAPLQRVRGRTLGIIGLGRIGTSLAYRAKALGMNIVFYDPYIPDGWDRTHAVTRAETLDELLAASYVVSIHCPATEETIGMIDAEAISKMPDRSFLINTARGKIIDTTAIPPAIHSGKLAGAGLDVLPDEPPGDDDPLITAWRDPDDPCHHRVIITPHAAFYSEQGLMDIRVKGAQACRRALLGMPLRNVVN